MTRNGFIVAFAIVAAAVLAWLWLRKTPIFQGGHATPDEAMSYGWAVFKRGLSGWEEHGPNGEIVDHDTGGEGVPG